jgi:hypothetical protein
VRGLNTCAKPPALNPAAARHRHRTLLRVLLAGWHDIAAQHGARAPALNAASLAARLTPPLLGGLVSGSALKEAVAAVAAWITHYPEVCLFGVNGMPLSFLTPRWAVVWPLAG